VILAQVAGIPSDQITEILKLGFPWPVIVLLCYYLVKKDKEIAELTTLRVSELKEVGAKTRSRGATLQHRVPQRFEGHGEQSNGKQCPNAGNGCRA
jgi:hypothetical protein